MKKNNLDEMQEQELLKIEHNGCWLAFWLLFASMAVESFAFGGLDFRTIAGEWTVFMILALYLAVSCVRKGIWDRRIPMTVKSNLIASAIAGVFLGAFNAALLIRKLQRPGDAVLFAVISGLICFGLCFGALTFMMNRTKKRKAAMEEEPEDADEI